MYPAGKVAISQHLATPGFPQCDHTVGKLSADAGSLCSEVWKSHAQNDRSDSTHMVHTNFNYPTCITEEANGVRQDLAEFQPPFRAEMADHPLNVTYTVCQKSIQYYTVCTKDPINSYSMLPNKSAVRITM